MKKLIEVIFPFFLVWILLGCGEKQKTFSEIITAVSALPAAEQNRFLDAYVKEQKALPIIEQNTVWFLVKDSASARMALSGDMCGWKADSLKMKPIAQSSYFYIRQTFPADARLEYKFVRNGTFILDPGNPLSDGGAYGTNSLLLMPAYRFAPEVLLTKDMKLTKPDTLHFKSALLKNSRTLFYYHHTQAGPLAPLIVFQDGADYLTFGKAQIVLDNLIRQKRLPALNALFVNPVKRMKEYWLNDAYLKMLFNELLPFIRKKYKLSAKAPLALGGASLGGLISVYALKDYRRQIRFVFSQSGSFWVQNGALLSDMGKIPEIKCKVYLGYGSYETHTHLQERLARILIKKKAQVKRAIAHEGHNWGNWRAHLAQALQFGLAR